MTIEGRRKQVLKAIVDHYIKYKEPVSSKMILREYDINVSSATVRNDMHYLEEKEYIKKPHISAGRVPTQKGYRLFVDWLIELSKITEKHSFSLMKRYKYQSREISELLRYTSFLLAQVSNYVGFVLSPRLEEMRLEYISLAQPTEDETIMIIGSEMGIIENIVIKMNWNSSEIAKVNQTLNERLKGKKFVKIKEMTEPEKEMTGLWHDQALRRAFSILQKLIEEKVKQRIYIEGLFNILQVMDGDDVKFDQLKALIRLLEDKARFSRVIISQREHINQGAKVTIGDENPVGELNDYSLITLNYIQSGILGVLGPMRMDYSKAVSSTKYIGDRLNAILQMT